MAACKCIMNTYNLDSKIIGVGVYGEVKTGTSRATNTSVVTKYMKIIELEMRYDDLSGLQMKRQY